MKQVGSFSLVLHTHLPWVAHHGTWPVGEEWLHQAFTGSWRRVLAVLDGLAAEGRTEQVSLGVTPVVAAMLDDPYCLRELHSWAGRWLLRAEDLGAGGRLEAIASYERAEALDCLADLDRRWLTGGLSGVLRPLLDGGVVELLGGPATHPFQPLLPERLAAAQLRTGLADAELRVGHRPAGIWAPECGYAPGMADFYAAHGVSHFVVDGPAVGEHTATGYLVDGTDVACFARDSAISAQVWSPRTGYPGHPDYRDFHTFDHDSGFRPARVTDRQSAAKQPWQPSAGHAQARRHAADFVAAVHRRLVDLAAAQDGEPLVVAAFDTELFGHWWHEGPVFLGELLRLLPTAGVRVRTLAGARQAGLADRAVTLPASSWGAGKDWRVWDNPAVADLNAELAGVGKRLFTVLDERCDRRGARDPVADQLAREALLASASDWAFMITRDSAADYARSRAAGHAARFHELADAVESGDRTAAHRLAARARQADGPFGHLDARTW